PARLAQRSRDVPSKRTMAPLSGARVGMSTLSTGFAGKSAIDPYGPVLAGLGGSELASAGTRAMRKPQSPALNVESRRVRPSARLSTESKSQLPPRNARWAPL